MLTVIGYGLGGFVLLAVVLFYGQDGMIFHPRPYGSQELDPMPHGLVALRGADGSLVGFYRAPADGTPPARLWFLFGGNGDLALRWDAFAIAHAQPGTGFLLMEYPGYGACAGKASPGTILQANEQAVGLLATRLGLETTELHRRAGALGHSLGAAAALQYAAQHPLRQLVLISPFTTMRAMARQQVGWPLCELLVHRFDNQACLAGIAASGLPPTAIIHGEADTVIPVAMSRALVVQHPAIRLSTIADAGHNDVLDLGDREVRAAMAE